MPKEEFMSKFIDYINSVKEGWDKAPSELQEQSESARTKARGPMLKAFSEFLDFIEIRNDQSLHYELLAKMTNFATGGKQAGGGRSGN